MDEGGMRGRNPLPAQKEGRVLKVPKHLFMLGTSAVLRPNPESPLFGTCSVLRNLSSLILRRSPDSPASSVLPVVGGRRDIENLE